MAAVVEAEFVAGQDQAPETLDALALVVRCITDLERDVNNGGFDQYFVNSSGNSSPWVVASLEQIDARATAAIVARALAVFGPPGPARSRDERMAQVEAFTPTQEATLDALDPLFFAYPDNLTLLLYRHVERERCLGARPGE